MGRIPEKNLDLGSGLPRKIGDGGSYFVHTEKLMKLSYGFGNGFMHAPAAGKVMAEYIASGRGATIPPKPFSASRFSGPRAEAKAALARE